MVVDGGVEVGVADPALAILPGSGGSPPAYLVAAAGWDAAQLLDVDADELAGPVTLVAADGLAGLAVEVGEPVEVVADQDAVHRGGRDAQPKADPVGTFLVKPAVADDPFLQTDGRPVR